MDLQPNTLTQVAIGETQIGRLEYPYQSKCFDTWDDSEYPEVNENRPNMPYSSAVRIYMFAMIILQWQKSWPMKFCILCILHTVAYSISAMQANLHVHKDNERLWVLSSVVSGLRMDVTAKCFPSLQRVYRQYVFISIALIQQ